MRRPTTAHPHRLLATSASCGSKRDEAGRNHLSGIDGATMRWRRDFWRRALVGERKGLLTWRRDPSRRALVKECERLLADLPIPSPFSVEALVRNMEEALGRQIRLIPMDDRDGGLGTACGLRVKAPGFTLIIYRRRSSRNQTVHIILHELSHEWLDHGTSLTDEQIKKYVPKRIREEVLRRFPGALVQGRVDFDSIEEKQAELSASLIKRLGRRLSVTGDDMVSLLEHSLAHPVAPPRRRH